MINIIREIDQNTVEIESDAGKYLDTGLIPQKRAVISKDNIKYVREVDEQEVTNDIIQIKKVYEG